jgi:Glycogen recognition site of AMP-activated protein kinase
MRRTRRLAMAGKPTPKAQRDRRRPGRICRPGTQRPARPAGRRPRVWPTRSPPLTGSRKISSEFAVRLVHGPRRRNQQRSVPTGTAAGQPDPPVQPAAKAGTVDGTFTLPVDVQAESVALCGQFNDWRADSIRLERGSNGCWRATVPLERRSYHYRYLLDGERRKNARQAGRHMPNAYGSAGSVVVVQ